jgi:hypothetical protein
VPTDGAQIVALYDALARVAPSPVVELNRAVAVGRAFGAQAGLDIIDAPAGPTRQPTDSSRFGLGLHAPQPHHRRANSQLRH